MSEVAHAVPRTAVRCGYLIAFQDGEHRLIRNGLLIYQGNTIEYVGEQREIGDALVVDAHDDIVSPGFISTHGHDSAPLGRCLRDDWGNPILYNSSLYETGRVMGRSTTTEIAALSARFFMYELISSGVTTVVDTTAWPEEAEGAANAIGMRCVLGQFFRSYDFASDGRSVTWNPVPERTEKAQYEEALDFALRDRGPTSLVTGCVPPLTLDDCSEELLRTSHEAARAGGRMFAIHGAESVVEFREILRRTGRTPVQYMDDIGILDSTTLLAHCLYIGGHSEVVYPRCGELELLAASGVGISHCPWVYARGGSALESFASYRQAGVRLSLGIDTPPLSMLAEMKMGAAVGKLVEANPMAVTARDMFDAATLGGADILQRPDLGRLAPGCAADFVCFRTRSLTMSPVRDPIKAIVYTAAPSDVSRVVIAGRTVLEEGECTGADVDAMAGELQAAAEGMWSQFALYDHAGRSLDEMIPPSVARWAPPGK